LRANISSLNGQTFDVVVIGGGISGMSSAQSMSGAGYKVLLVEKQDFASAASSRSGHMVHCGLRYLAPSKSLWEFVWHPSRLRTALHSGRRAVRTRGQFVTATPERMRPLDIAYPIYEDSPFAGWQFDLGARLLHWFDSYNVSLEYKRMTPAQAKFNPLVAGLRDQHRLKNIVMFRDYRIEWPERIALDEVLNAEELGAVIRNYTKAIGFRRRPEGGWSIDLEDTLQPGERATVAGRVLLNMAGVWVDDVNRSGPAANASRKIVAVKGSHIVVRLPPEFKGHGIYGFNRDNEQIFCLPWKGDTHYIGPTETIYEGNLEDVYPTEEDIAWLIDEINHMVPMLGIKRSDVMFSWAGARPITFDPHRAKGKRLPFGLIHDMAEEGIPDMFSLTWAAIMMHREVAGDVVKAVGQRLKPTGPARPISYAARQFPDNTNSPSLVDTDRSPTIADLRYSAAHEHPQHLVDLLFRRTGIGWRTNLPRDAVERAAKAVADELGWDEERQAAEVEAYRMHVRRYHLQE
jgi:glycerol-3-phosphate dehydrogenase